MKLLATLLLAFTSTASAQQYCYSDTTALVEAMGQNRTSADDILTYKLCKDTVFPIGRFGDLGLEGGDEPVALHMGTGKEHLVLTMSQ
jgi:hypothetical protein